MGKSQNSGSAASATRPNRSRAKWLAVVGGLLVLAIIAAVAYYALSGFFNANGTWYGPMHVKRGGATFQVESYMNISTSFTGSISGSGTFCLPLPFNNSTSADYAITGNRAFVLPGRDNPQPVTVTAEEAVQLAFGVTIPIGPNHTMHGNVVNDTLKLTGGDKDTSTALDMKHGSKADFTNACKSLSPLG